MTTDFRALCAELVNSINSYLFFVDGETTTAGERAERLNKAISTAVAALNEPQPPTFLDAIRLAKGSHDYSGGYGGTPCAEAFHAGIGTVVNVLEKAATGPWDYQTQAVFRAADDPSPTAGSMMPTEQQAQARRILGLGWEPGDGTEDGAQLIDGDWWFPALGCDSLQETVLQVRYLLSAEAALAEPQPPAESVIPDSCDRGLLPMIVSETGADHEPETERIICSAISGGADYLNEMPREVSLERITSAGVTFRARYLQVPLEVADPQPPADGEVEELVAELKGYIEQGTPLRLVPSVVQRAADLLERLAATVKQSLTVEPTDDAAECWAEDQGFIRGYAEHPCGFWIDTGDIGKITRAVLARWGRSAPQPVPVAERRPEAKHCDAEGKCWWWYPPIPEHTYGYWLHEDDAKERALDEWPTHWLPVHALPVPISELKNLK